MCESIDLYMYIFDEHFFFPLNVEGFFFVFVGFLFFGIETVVQLTCNPLHSFSGIRRLNNKNTSLSGL